MGWREHIMIKVVNMTGFSQELLYRVPTYMYMYRLHVHYIKDSDVH